ncbi:predicted protein [Naegleria gruberi]|uniref:Predicted protein n=1 Tax=Naegleria gruberi TaxID=5762 RepID=D2V3V3_NAEGR|nr:uncharacterized protein NAEGRDRAFT_46479 [Naegleria gruberi]EFC48259.1 predicted protein [Naegleria gruberi]|eukprot:XP_002681003.1 predicted protein [Naegleria gruberi strain NEG-M]
MVNSAREHQEGLFSNDVCFEILSFLDGWTIIRNCALISKQWFEIIRNYSKLDLEVMSKLSTERITMLSESQFLNRIIGFKVGKYAASEFVLFESSNLEQLWETIGSMSQLTKLDVGKTGLHTFPISILPNLENLTELNLTFLEIFDQGAKIISQRLKFITKLSVDYCGIGIEGVQAIGNMKQLTFLNISENEMRNEEIELIGTLDQLKYLSIRNITRENNSVDDYLDFNSLKNLKLLTYLNIGENRISDEIGLQFLREMKQLTHLNVANMEIGSIGAKIISEMTHLVKLNIGRNDIGRTGIDYIGEMKQLTSLNVQNCNLMECKFLCGMKQLQYLNISENTIRNEGVDLICKELSQLKFLNISEILSRPYQFRNVLPIKLENLPRLNQLTELDLSSDRVNEESLIFLLELKCLTSLNVRRNSITCNCAKIISGMSQLTKLNISETQVDELVMEYICGMKELRVLYMQKNYLENDSEVVDLIEKMESLTELDISDCYISIENETKLREIKKLRKLVLFA